MAAEIVNLRQARKRRRRSEDDKAAERNRIEFGRTRNERDLTRALNEQESRRHAARRLEPRTDGTGPNDVEPD
jgi:hypothetical protein